MKEPWVPMVDVLFTFLCPVKAVLIFSAADEVLISFVLNPLLGDPRGVFLGRKKRENLESPGR